jgi:4-amino-4-deoxy-L-arabinose transferase-like glycosyltransferase
VSKRASILLALLVLVGALLRLPLLASRSLWFDEVMTWSGDEQTLHPPLFTLMMFPVRHVADGELALRLPSYLLGVLAIALAYRVGADWLSRRGGLVFAALVACSPVCVFYSREARPYSLAMTLELAVMVALGRLAKAPTRRAVAAVVATTALASVTVYLALVVAFAAHLAALRRRLLVPLAVSLACAGTLVAACLWVFLRAVLRTQTVSGKPYLHDFFAEPSLGVPFVAKHLPELFGYFVCGRDWRYVSLLALAVSLAGALSRPRIGLLGLFPVAFTLVAACFHLHPFGGVRHCVPLLPGVLLVLACGITEIGRSSRIGGALVAAFFVGAAAHELPAARSLYFEDMAGLVATVRSRAAPGDAVVVDPPSRPAFDYYTRNAPWSGPVSAGGEEWLASGPLAATIESSLATSPRVWVLHGLKRRDVVQRAEAIVGAHHERRDEVVDPEGQGVRAALWVR